MTTTLPGSGPRKLIIALIAMGSVLLLAVVATIFLLIGQNASRPGSINADAPQPGPVATESASPVADPIDDPVTVGTGTTGGTSGGSNSDTGQAPVDNSVRFTNFSADLTVECDPTGQADEKAQPSISWTSANAVTVYWTPNNQEANADNGYQVGASGNQNDMSASKGPGERYEFPCNHRQTFDTTITLIGANGQKVSKTVTFTDINWNTGGNDDDY